MAFFADCNDTVKHPLLGSIAEFNPDGSGTVLLRQHKTPRGPLLSGSLTENDHFTKTGSGQT
jgi:hypothetical protein|eukprot:COSAG06_NODE_610_length_13844_cov_14.456359_10_plen_62_part_00